MGQFDNCPMLKLAIHLALSSSFLSVYFEIKIDFSFNKPKRYIIEHYP